jgi:hypothetical protein
LRLTLDNKLVGRAFQAKCTTSGAFVYDFEALSDSLAPLRTTLTVECFIPDRCRLDVLSFDDRTLVSAKFIANNTRTTFGAWLLSGSVLLRVPIHAQTRVSVNGNAVSSTDALLTVTGPENALISSKAHVSVPGKCLRRS